MAEYRKRWLLSAEVSYRDLLQLDRSGIRIETEPQEEIQLQLGFGGVSQHVRLQRPAMYAITFSAKEETLLHLLCAPNVTLLDSTYNF